ncbi:metal-sulfur cluster assembly factor [Salipaludibacillus sp. HK11]|uniref:metal-sulfur cluster assembly factor n=1 Tax=Salipaludibacillus sp. HK11 TaxID=3394320 RepID=UPI0039FB9CEF
MTQIIEEKVYEALGEVVDPEINMDIVNLGLVYNVKIGDKNDAHIEMTLTSMGCPMAGQIVTSVKTTVANMVEEIEHVEVDIVWSPVWGKERMSRYAKMALRIPG